MAITFRYKSVNRPDGTSVRIPSIPVTLVGPRESIELIALMDSGADISVIPREVAEVLGLDLSGETESVFGLGGSVRAIPLQINMVIEKGHECYRLNIPIKVVLDKYDFPPLLGRAGFFEEFEITLNQLEEKICLKKVDRTRSRYRP